MKMLCNKCYTNELIIHDYDGILYVDPCSCIQEEYEYDLKEVVEQSLEDGYYNGYCSGRDDFRENLISGDEVPEYYDDIMRRIKIRLKNSHGEHMKPIVIIINGYPTSGKDTFCDFADDDYMNIHYSTVDTVKYLASDMGWNGRKSPENRNMLSALKDFYVKWFDGTFNEMTKIIRDEIICCDKPCGNFIFFHIREPEEITRVKQYCAESNVDCYTVFLIRDEVENTNHGNHADNNVANMSYDVIVTNNGTLDDFKVKTKQVLHDIQSGTIK